MGCHCFVSADPAFVGIPSLLTGKVTPTSENRGPCFAMPDGPCCLPGRSGAKLATQIRAGLSMLLVTGGAGFIGSNLVAALNDAGRSDVAICDVLGDSGKWRNLAKRRLADIVAPAEL